MSVPQAVLPFRPRQVVLVDVRRSPTLVLLGVHEVEDAWRVLSSLQWVSLHSK